MCNDEKTRAFVRCNDDHFVVNSGLFDEEKKLSRMYKWVSYIVYFTLPSEVYSLHEPAIR